VVGFFLRAGRSRVVEVSLDPRKEVEAPRLLFRKETIDE
jgi:hypothetical protein